eukprot:tig00000194_g14749.t1
MAGFVSIVPLGRSGLAPSQLSWLSTPRAADHACRSAAWHTARGATRRLRAFCVSRGSVTARSFTFGHAASLTKEFFGASIRQIEATREGPGSSTCVIITMNLSDLGAELFGKAALKVLVVGSGGREHALCRSIRKSPLCQQLFCAPGNAGIADDAVCVTSLSATDVAGVVDFCKSNAIDFVVVGPEAPLVVGLVDALEKEGIPAFGPSKEAARMEGSKAFMKDFCARNNIPTGAYARFTSVDEAQKYIKTQGAPIVIKTDGLAAGKGVIIAQTEDEAIAAVNSMMKDKAFGSAGDEIVIEEFLEGEEASFFALTDGKTAVALVSAQDHKAVGEGDTGPNTGGMGAYSPAPVMSKEIEAAVMRDIIQPTVDGMASEGRPFKGVLFAGLMIKDGKAKLLEFNIRFGDPECQALCSRLQSDLLIPLMSSATGRISSMPEMQWSPDTALCVVMAAQGYPGSYKSGTVIRGLGDADAVPGVDVFHAGTAFSTVDGKEEVVATGGRVLGVTARATTVKEAQRLAYTAVDKINWPEGFCRRDIGWRAVSRS